jgi:hypothetical protein
MGNLFTVRVGNILTEIVGKVLDICNVPRNRLYPVGAALGYLCDFLGLEWKPTAQAAGPEFAFHLLLSRRLNAVETPAEELIGRANLLPPLSCHFLFP